MELPVSSSAVEKMLGLLDLLHKWNKVYNLTSVRSKQDMLSVHLFDSLSVARFLKGNHILDIGTGAGFPGLPLAILNPERCFYLLDSNGKKTRFVQQAVIDLGLTNVKVFNDRIENFTCDVGIDTFVTRAFASMVKSLDLTNHLVNNNSRFIFLKGPEITTELTDLPVSLGVKSYDLSVPGLDAVRKALIIDLINA